MKTIIGVLAVLSISSVAQAQNLFPGESIPADCRVQAPEYDKNISLGEKTPEYFFKPIYKQNSGDARDEISLIIDGKNYIMDMADGKLRQIPGPYDGVPTPDGQFIVSPAKGDRIQFFDRDGISATSTSLYDDRSSGNQLDGVYHSLGVTSQKQVGANKEVTYKAITDSVTTNGTANVLQYKTYTFEISPTGEKKLLKESGAPKLLCSNFLNKTIKTPIISKDGSMLSAYNEETGTTMIYDIQVDASGASNCKMKKDLGFATSKMEFSPDGKKVVFAMNSLQTTPSEVSWYSQPPRNSHNMNVFVYDMTSDSVKKVSTEDRGNAYYPSFSNDGNDVVFLSQELRDGNTYYSVKRVKLDSTPETKFIDFSEASSCKLVDPNAIDLMALGKLWESVCSTYKESMTLSGLGLLPLSLSKDNCEKLVKNNWERFKTTANEKTYLSLDQGKKSETLDPADSEFYMKKFLSVKQESLLNICSTLKAPNRGPAERKDIVADGEMGDASAPESSCTQCHSANSTGPYIPFDKPEKLGPYKRKMLLHVLTGNMPKNMSLSKEQRERIVDYLEAIPEE